jgi:hypothetical protein
LKDLLITIAKKIAQMKNIGFISFLAAAFLVGAPTLITSCKKDPCKDVTCENGGTCDDGKCNCPAGYEGEKCEKKLPVVSGTWAVTHMESVAGKFPVNDNGMTFVFNSCVAGNTCGAQWTIIETSSSGTYKNTQVIDLTYNLAKDGTSMVLTRSKSVETEVDNGKTTVTSESCSSDCTVTPKVSGLPGTSIILNFEKDGLKLYLTKK